MKPRKALFANAKLKSFDFVVYSKSGPNLLVDVKGRQVRRGAGKGSFETWTTEQDVTRFDAVGAGVWRGI